MTINVDGTDINLATNFGRVPFENIEVAYNTTTTNANTPGVATNGARTSKLKMKAMYTYLFGSSDLEYKRILTKDTAKHHHSGPSAWKLISQLSLDTASNSFFNPLLIIEKSLPQVGNQTPPSHLIFFVSSVNHIMRNLMLISEGNKTFLMKEHPSILKLSTRKICRSSMLFSQMAFEKSNPPKTKT